MNAKPSLARRYSRSPACTGSHYEGDETARRVARLYDHVVVAATRRDLGPIVAYAQELAVERYTGGYALAELQAAFNALEEALWEALVEHLPQIR